LAACGREWHEAEVPRPPTCKNDESQKVLPPPASWCHSLPEWLSSPSRIENNRRFLQEYRVSEPKATQNPTHSQLRRRPQGAALARSMRRGQVKGRQAHSPHRHPNSNHATAYRGSEPSVRVSTRKRVQASRSATGLEIFREVPFLGLGRTNSCRSPCR
jgi:hypothetical protein